MTPEYNRHSRELELSILFPSLPVGIVGRGTNYPAQKECLQILKCDTSGQKVASLDAVPAFVLALGASTSAAVTNNTFASAHVRLRKL